MSLGPTEILVLIFNLVLFVAVPAVIIVVAVLLIRRIRDLETRVAKLEEESDRGKRT